MKNENINLANALSFSRIIFGLVIFILFFIITKMELSISTVIFLQIFSFVLFILGIISDALDGYFARKSNTVTDFGKHFDPLADSFFFILIFFTFLYISLMPWYFFIIVLFREVFMHFFLRPYFKKKGSSLPANIYGKIKTFFQAIFSVMIILGLICKQFIMIYSTNRVLNLYNHYLVLIAYIMFALISFLSLASLIIYLFKFKDLLSSSK